MTAWAQASAQPEFAARFHGQLRIAPAGASWIRKGASSAAARALDQMAKRVRGRTNVFLVAIGVFGVGLTFLFLTAGRPALRAVDGFNSTELKLTLGLLLCAGSMIVAMVAWCLTVSSVWDFINHIPGHRASLGPALAVGLMFVPVFNLFWIFRVLIGATTELRSAGESCGVRLEVPGGLAM